MKTILCLTLALLAAPLFATPLAPTYGSLLENVFQPKCLLCHGVGSETGVVLATYDDLISSQIVVPGAPERSPLYRAVISEKPGVAPLMPKRSAGRPPAYLGPDETNAIADWIRAGAPPDTKEEM